jgi:hypothetical protein
VIETGFDKPLTARKTDVVFWWDSMGGICMVSGVGSGEFHPWRSGGGTAR